MQSTSRRSERWQNLCLLLGFAGQFIWGALRSLLTSWPARVCVATLAWLVMGLFLLIGLPAMIAADTLKKFIGRILR